MLQILLAFVAGILTIAAPCILLPLPIIFGTSVGQKSKTRPLFITLGFVIAFAILGISLNFLIQHLGLSPNALRNGAAVLLAIFAFFMIWPKPFEILMTHMSGVINKASQTGQKAGSGNFGGFVIGLIIGIVWAPCAGPILGSILTLIAQQQDIVRATGLLIAYAVGAGVPMLAIAYGGQYATTKIKGLVKYSVLLQQIFGVIILLLAIAIFFQYDTIITAKLTEKFPSIASTFGSSSLTPKLPNQSSSTNSSSKVTFKNLGPAPELTGIENWINSDPLTLAELKGKVVLIDFWTYSCINCIRTLPYVTKWYDTYKDKGFVVLGVHTPEFAFEKDTNNVTKAIGQYNIHYPVAQDNDFKTWNAYGNQFWPAEYLIDKNGDIVYTHFGEGRYDITEDAIRQLLGMSGDVSKDNGQDLSKINSPEMYFGTAREENLDSTQSPKSTPTSYKLPSVLPLNKFALEGTWKFDADKAILANGSGKIKLHFDSGKVHFVCRSDNPITLNIIVDGQQMDSVTVQQSQLYTLFDSNDYRDHTIEISIPSSGLEAFTFTFG